MTTVIKHSLRAGVGASGGYRAEGWLPALDLTIVGPTPASASLVWAVAPPGGGMWREERVAVPMLGAGEAAAVRLRCDPASEGFVVAGTVSFLLRVVSELDGVDEVLHDGRFEVREREGVFSIDEAWLTSTAELGLDTVDEPDGPRLVARVTLAGDVDAYAVEGHCFVDGTRLSPPATVSAGRAVTAHDGSVVGQEVELVFDGVRGWNNLAASGWGAGWHLLSEHDGAYAVKLVLAGTAVATVPFAVAGGRLVAPRAVEVDPRIGAVLLVPVEAGPSVAGSDVVPATPPFYGDERSAADWCTLDEVYAAQRFPVVMQHPVLEVGADQQRAYVDRAERLLLTWEAEILGAFPPIGADQVLNAEALGREEVDYERLRDAVAAVPDDHQAQVGGEPSTYGAIRARVDRLLAAARALIVSASAAQEDELAPYRALLAGDKLAVFEEHPANAFVYTTTDRRVIETPEELAAADCWFFEGPLDLASTVSVTGAPSSPGTADLRVTTQGWRVLGWRFAPDGSIVDRFESQGPGPAAPLSSFRAPD
ncbi:MAG: hypothetical protein Q7T71_14795 [Herbiconiux sp.]|nr:hypothetical protein [Herbiconiux sp.]